MSTVATLIALAVLFALGVVVGMISAAGAYAHLERRYNIVYATLERIATTAPDNAAAQAWEALEGDHEIRIKGVPRALD